MGRLSEQDKVRAITLFKYSDITMSYPRSSVISLSFNCKPSCWFRSEDRPLLDYVGHGMYLEFEFELYKPDDTLLCLLPELTRVYKIYVGSNK